MLCRKGWHHSYCLFADDVIACSVSLEDFEGQQFGLARVVKKPKDYGAITVQWFESKKQFGQKTLATTPTGKPWTQIISAKVIITKPFQLQDGFIPHEIATELKSMRDSRDYLEELQLRDLDSDTDPDTDED